ncbi:type IV toxin-antitoxin system AbiEi family antitoxin domain-containing protein [Nocardia gipuzkoensis]|uniref:type IV toxin-antitoxin system AbiEi family antitoxin domain-containing protein n=1 Tax=Nocardia gipuzkoensis TaxID=2749991 RepID=UPI00237E14D3|nr:type IV toxin-antitoxin system AbiEi family antitoxin domain-containing protein [Nocardia gipuzkoensis]MDE1675281.1 type IV toxin-antitoxin system AbiEi family antitoxin domain-containing protein [Nocardia gipuzkoensis]
MKSEERLLGLADVAGVQWGLFTSAQAGEVGVSAQQLKRLADSELVVRLRQGVYRLTGAPESPADPVRAEWLALEPNRLAGDRLSDEVPVGVVSHRSAARLQDLGDIDADVHEFTVSRRRSTRSPDVKFRIRDLGREDWHLVEGLPVTRPRRTVVDLAADGIDGGHLATIVRDAILTGEVTRDELATALRPYAHRYGVQIGDGAALVRDFIGQAGIPEASKALTRDIDISFPDRHGKLFLQVKGPMGTDNEERAKLFLDNLVARNPGIDTAFARHSDRIAGALLPQPSLPTANLIPTLPENWVSAVLGDLAANIREGLSSKVFAKHFSEAARNYMAEVMRDPDVWAGPDRAPVEKTGESDSEGSEDSDPEISDGRRASESDQCPDRQAGPDPEATQGRATP